MCIHIEVFTGSRSGIHVKGPMHHGLDGRFVEIPRSCQPGGLPEAAMEKRLASAKLVLEPGLEKGELPRNGSCQQIKASCDGPSTKFLFPFQGKGCRNSQAMGPGPYVSPGDLVVLRPADG